MKRYRKIIVIVIVAVAVSMGLKIGYSYYFTKSIYSIQFGSDYGDGSSVKGKLNYSFNIKGIDKTTSVKDVVNVIYFKGDTVCFSFKVTKPLLDKNLKVYFVNNATGERFKAERLDRDGNSFRGMSLVGSLLEEFRVSEFLEKYVDFELVIEVGDESITNKVAGNSVIYSVSIFSSFYVNVNGCSSSNIGK